jgi:hypothetical protein
VILSNLFPYDKRKPIVCNAGSLKSLARSMSPGDAILRRFASRISSRNPRNSPLWVDDNYIVMR